MRRFFRRKPREGVNVQPEILARVDKNEDQAPVSARDDSLQERRALIQVARGKSQADLVLQNARVVNVFSNEVYQADVAVHHGRVAGIGAPGAYSGAVAVDLGGQYLVPGLVEAHTHIEDA